MAVGSADRLPYCLTTLTAPPDRGATLLKEASSGRDRRRENGVKDEGLLEAKVRGIGRITRHRGSRHDGVALYHAEEALEGRRCE